MGQLIPKKEPNYTPSQLTPQNNLYTTKWESKSMKKLILERKVAPFQKGSIEQHDDEDECPICFFYYSGGLNIAKCCKNGICTECYFSCNSPDVVVSCPFCRAPSYVASFKGPKTPEERQKEEEEKQRFIAHEKRLEEEKGKILKGAPTERSKSETSETKKKGKRKILTTGGSGTSSSSLSTSVKVI